MSTGRAIGLAILGLFIGGIAGGCFGLLGGLAYTEVAATSGFEGHSGFVVAYWLAAGVIVGMVTGLSMAIRRGRR